MLRILICDGEAGTRLLLKRTLVREFQAAVTEAADGLRALELRRSPPDQVGTWMRRGGRVGSRVSNRRL